jgi:hypothetical protein
MMLWQTVKFNFALVGFGLGSESLAKPFRHDSPIPTIVEPPLTASIDAPADVGNLAIRAERAKSVLDGLNLDTAIRLRWVLRDIRAKRTKLSPISQNDLMALIELGLIEKQNDEPALTNEGMRAIGYLTGPDEGERGE